MCDEGAEVGYTGVSFSHECETMCKVTEGCESFTFCSRDDGVQSDCYLKDKTLTRDEAINPNCASYYKKCDYGTYSEISYRFPNIKKLIIFI